MSPISISMTTFDLLGSPFNSERFVFDISNFSWVNFLILREESDLIVAIVPLVSSSTIFDEGPVFTV